MLVDPLHFLKLNLLIVFVVVVVLLFASLGWVGWMAGVGVSTECGPPPQPNAHFWISCFLKNRISWFLAFPLRRCEKLKKSRYRQRGVAKTIFDVPTLHGKHKKKRFPCSMGMSKMVFATPLGRERQK